MRVVVCCKQIPDPASPYALDPATHLLVRPTEQILDDTDRYGVEMGLQIAGATGGTLTLVSMGPAGSLHGIRQALAMGADAAVVIDDRELKGADALLTARILAAAVVRHGFDLVIAGTESTDGSAGVVPQMLAEILGVPALTYATKVAVEGDRVTIHRQTASGYDVVVSPIPVVVSVTSGAVEPRYPTFKGIMEAKKKPLTTITAAQLGVDITVAQEMVAAEGAPARSAGRKIEDDGEAHREIVKLLEHVKVI